MSGQVPCVGAEGRDGAGPTPSPAADGAGCAKRLQSLSPACVLLMRQHREHLRGPSSVSRTVPAPGSFTPQTLSCPSPALQLLV